MLTVQAPLKSPLFALFLSVPLACNDGKVKDTGSPPPPQTQTTDTSELTDQIDTLTAQMSEMQSQIDQLSDALAASESLNLQLQNETLRWEVIEYVCTSDGLEPTGIELGEALGILYRKYVYNNNTLVYASAISNRDVVVLDETTGQLDINCAGPAEEYTEVRFVISLGYPR